MNIQEILEKINEITSDCSCKMNLVHKNRTQYSFYPTPLEDGIQEGLKGFITSSLMDILDNNSLEPFNLTGKPDYTIEYIAVEDVANYVDLNNCYNNPENEIDSLDIETINAYLIHLESSDGQSNLKIFRRYSKSKSLSKGFRLIRKNNIFDKLVDNIFIVDDNIDFIVLNDETIIIINRYAFEIITNYKDNYLESLNNALQEIENSNLIGNIELFKEHCRNSMRIAKQFTRAMNNNSISMIKNNPQKVSQAIIDAQLPITFENNQFVYDSKEQLAFLVALLSDEYARTLIGGDIAQIR